MSTLVGWGLTLAITTVGGIMASITHTDAKLEVIQSQVSDSVVKIATLDTKSDDYRRDIDSINKKLDALLWANNINPTKIVSPTLSSQ